MSEIEIVTETEGQYQWTYQVRLFDAGRTRLYDLTLSWSDHDLWCISASYPLRVPWSDARRDVLRHGHLDTR